MTTSVSTSTSTPWLHTRTGTAIYHPTTHPRFAGYHVIVTGGASGIGACTVDEFIREGASYVAILDIQEQAGKELEKLYPGKVLFYKVDVSDASACRSAVSSFASHAGGVIHVLFNNAAYFGSHGMDATPSDFAKSWQVNVVGYANMVQAVVPYMESSKTQGRGSIINNGSISSSRPSKNRWTYCSTKGAIHTMTKCMALDLSAKRIRVNMISPGWIWSPEVHKAAADGGKEKWDPIWGNFHMLRRCGELIEVARVVLFLASLDSSFITASDIPVDGGYMQMTAEGFGEQSNFAGHETTTMTSKL